MQRQSGHPERSSGRDGRRTQSKDARPARSFDSASLALATRGMLPGLTHLELPAQTRRESPNSRRVPLKFEIFAGGELTGISYVSPLYATKSPRNSTNPTNEIEATATGGTTLRYDTTGGQFIHNWQTPKEPGACFKVSVKTVDGGALTPYFKLR